MNAPEPAGTHAPTMILGVVASSGLARGRALLCDCAKRTAAPRRQVSEAGAQSEFDRFDPAVAAVEENLLAVQASVERTLGKGEAKIFEAQILLLRDPQLRDAVRDLCLGQRMNVEVAVEEAIQAMTDLFARLEDPYFRERASDLYDVGKRLLDQLTENLQPSLPVLPDGCVLVTSELYASVVAQLEGRSVRGLVVERGGLTAHATILARALGIPMLVHVPDATRQIRPGDLIIVDALAGRVFINPKPEIIRKYDQLSADLEVHQSVLRDLIDLPTITADGVAIKLSANIGQTADAMAAAGVKADGVGLYRTEFIFLVQEQFPSEEEQYQLYRASAGHLQRGETVIRVLDIGSDKPLPYFPLAPEANPALGRRGMRLLLAHPKILQTQLRAILRLSTSHPVAILLPMIGGMDELRAANAVIEKVKAELAAEGQPFNSLIPIGAMIETPAAAILIGQMAAEVDFFSVGTNDLVQYLLAADRIGGDEASAYEPLHPAVLQVLARLAEVAKAKDKPICLCGEMASDPANTTLLLGLGFGSFSVSPGRLLEIKHAVRSIRLTEAEKFAGEILALTSLQAIKVRVKDEWLRRSPVSSPVIRVADPATVTPPPIIHNVKLQRFETRVNDAALAFLSYVPEGGRVILDHTFVPDGLRGRGIAAALTRAALNEARQRHWKIIPRCSYVAAFIARNPAYADLIQQE